MATTPTRERKGIYGKGGASALLPRLRHYPPRGPLPLGIIDKHELKYQGHVALKVTVLLLL